MCLLLESPLQPVGSLPSGGTHGLQKLMSEKINEAYKEGQRDAHRFLKEMRSFFP